MTCFFAADLHGSRARYRALFAAIAAERPRAVFLGGDLLPHPCAEPPGFVPDVLAAGLEQLRAELGDAFPRVFAIPGNDDAASFADDLADLSARGLVDAIHERSAAFDTFDVAGYACVPPTPFWLKAWDRYDVSRYVDPGCSPPAEGLPTIADDLERIAASIDSARAIVLLHSPPYQTVLDRAALDGRFVDHCPLDVHVGSIAVRRFIENRQPVITLHGHVHESVRLTGAWRERIGRTWIMGAAHDGPELALVRFDPVRPEEATRELIV